MTVPDRAYRYFEKMARRSGYMYKGDGKLSTIFSTKPMGMGNIFSLVEVKDNVLLCYESPSKRIAYRSEIIIPDDFE